MGEPLLEAPPHISIDQILFGYDDGHRMLASSSSVATEISRDLVMLSDLVPGAILEGDSSYWTGTPLRQHRSYALMRTWLAPEMPRPGCVWTHALVLKGADLGSLEDLSSLELLFRKPTKGTLASYQLPIKFQGRVSRSSPASFDRHFAANAISALYAQDKPRILTAAPGQLETVIFQIWSQQWPRLRRSFSFRTAVTRSEQRGDVVKLDLRVRGGSAEAQNLSGDQPETWLETAVSDLVFVQASPFRKFLRRYGADLRRGRPQFRLLAEIYARTRKEAFTDTEVAEMIDLLVENIPDPSEGARLKFDLFSSQSELMPHVDPMCVLRVSLTRGSFSLPNLSESLGISLQTLWPERAEEIFALAEQALEQPSDVGDRVVNLVVSLVGVDDILRATAGHPRLRAKLISASPKILDSSELSSLPASQIIDLVGAADLPNDIVLSVLSRCLKVDEYWFANRLYSMFGENLLRVIFGETITHGSIAVSPAFRMIFRSHTDVFISLNLASRIRFLSEGWRAAHLLGWDSYTVMRLGSEPWAGVLRNSEDDLEVWQRIDFYAFLFSVATENSVDAEEIFEMTYPTLLHAADDNRLTEFAIQTLKRHLPYLGYSGGSIERRLSSAIARGYVNGRLDRATFPNLFRTKLGMDHLIREVGELSGGSRFLQSITAREVKEKQPKSRKSKGGK